MSGSESGSESGSRIRTLTHSAQNVIKLWWIKLCV